MEKLKEKILEKVWENREKIVRMALDATNDIETIVVWYDWEDDEFSVGHYTTGTYENPENIRTAVPVYSLPQGWEKMDNIDEDLCWERDEDGNPHRTSENVDYEAGRKESLTTEEQYEDYFDMLFEYFVTVDFPELEEKLEEILEK